MTNLTELFRQLGLTEDNGLYLFEARKWEGIFSQKTEYALTKVHPDAFFCFNNEPLILFFESPEDEHKVHKNCWNFNKAPVIIINTPTTLKIYNGFDFDSKKSRLKKLANHTDKKNFSYWNIVSGQLWKQYQEKLSGRKRLDYKLLRNIRAARDELIGKDKKKDGDEEEKKYLTSSTANKLIGRLIFTRYLIDRKIKIDFSQTNNGILTNEEFLDFIQDRDRLYDFFEHLNSRFKGDLFPLNGEKEDVTDDHLKVLYSLFRGDMIKTRQRSLFDIYNFDIIPVEFVSNIYEFFLGKTNQKTDKSFYTPPFLVDYILEGTVAQSLKKQNDKVSCRILDPSCGSGIFLVETLRLLILRFRELNPGIKPAQREFKEAIKKLLVDNIFGIDKAKEALEIATFSLYITLLDFFEEPKDINGIEFPYLLGSNLIVADFFDIRHSYNNGFGQAGEIKHFDFILGNPPWGKVDSPYKKYLKIRTNEEGVKVDVSNEQIAQAFMLRVSDFSDEETVSCLVVSSKILYNLKAKDFREYFVKKYFIDEIFELSSVRHQIFVNAVGPAAIVKFRFAFNKNTGDNKVVHISLKPNYYFEHFKSIAIEKSDYKEIKQSYFTEYDWIWKVLVYGSVLDFYFIKRLRDRKKFTSINKLLDDKKNRLISGEGVQVGGGDSFNSSHLIGKTFIDAKPESSDFTPFFIDTKINRTWSLETCHRPREKDLFIAPLLLVKGSTKSDFKIIASTCDKDIVYTDYAFGVKHYGDAEILKNFLGLLASDLATYFIFITGSSTGIEREQIFKKELFDFPAIIDDEIVEKTKKLIELHKKDHDPESFKTGGFQREIDEATQDLNKLIFDLYRLDETEKDLLDYAFNISIPVLQDSENRLPFNRLSSCQVNNYAKLFCRHFSKFHDGGENGYFQVDVYETHTVLAMNFKIVPEKPARIIQRRREKSNEKIIDLLAGVAFQKISKGLFIQKDVKGIRRDSFYVIKPNQYKYWHRAIARLDIIEFENSMLQSQLEGRVNDQS